MGQTPPNARRATDVLQCDEAKTAANGGYTALAGGDDAATSKWVPSRGRIARFARGKAAIFGSSDKLKPGSWLLYHGFVMLDVVWEEEASDSTTADDAAVVASLVKSEASAGAGVTAATSAASATAAATPTATGKVLHREFWRIEFNHRCRVWMTKFDVLPEPYAAALHWEIPPVERRMASLPARQAGLFDARYNNSQHYQQRVLRFLRGRRRQPPSEWFKFWKWGSNCGGDVDTAPASATAADPKSEAAAADNNADDKDDASAKEADDDNAAATAVATTTIDEVPPTDAAVSSSTPAAATCGLRRRHQRRAAAAANACGVFEPTAMPARAAGPAPLAAPSAPSLRYYPAPTAEPPTAAYAFGPGVGAGAGAGAGVGAGAGATETHSVVHRPDYYEVLLPTAPTSEAVGAHGVLDAVSSSGGGAGHRRQMQGMEPATSCTPRAHDPRTSHGGGKRLPTLHAGGRRSRPRTPMLRGRQVARHGPGAVRSALLRLV